MIQLLVCDWHHTCGDGCCDEFGRDLYVDGDLVQQHVWDEQIDLIGKLLKRLNIPYNMEYCDEETVFKHKLK